MSRRSSTASSIAHAPAAPMPTTSDKQPEGGAAQGDAAADVPQLDQAELDRHVRVTLQETDSFMLLEMPGKG